MAAKIPREWRPIWCPLMLALFAVAAGMAQGRSGGAWTVVGPGGGGTTIAPTISPYDSGLVVEHSDMTGGYITRDDGLSWKMVNLRGGIEVFAFDPSDPQAIYAGNAGLWRSSDSGGTWKLVFPEPGRGTIEHQVSDHSDYVLTSGDRAYPGGEVSAIAFDEPKDGGADLGSKGSLYVSFQRWGQPTVILKSADGGATWSRFATLPQGVLMLRCDGDVLIAVSEAGVVRLAADGSMRAAGDLPWKIHAVSSARSGDSIWIYATGEDGKVYLSKDGGLRWGSVTPKLQQTAGRFEAIATSERHPEVAYAGFRGLQIGVGKESLFNGIAKTTDGGQSWKIVFKESTHAAANLRGSWIERRAGQDNINIWFDAPYSLGVAPTNPDIAYATDLFRTYRTLDGGATWVEVNSRQVGEGNWVTRGLDVTTNYGVQFDPFDPRHIFMDNSDMGLFESANGGGSWRSSSEGIPEDWRNTTYWVAFDPGRRGRIWGAFSGVHDLPRAKMWRNRKVGDFTGGVAVSADGGKHWTPSGTGLPKSAITHILLDPASPIGSRVLYVCAFGHGVYKSTDGGRSWVQKNRGIAGDEPFAWRITASTDGALYLVVARRSEGKDYSSREAGAVYRSTDKAEHWQRMELPSGVTGPTGVAVDPRDPQRIYVTAWGQEGEDSDKNGGVYGSEDGGKTWRSLFADSQHVYDITIDPKHPDTLYFTGFDAAAYRSTDRGNHWERIRGYDFKWGHRVIVDPNDPTRIYITTYGGGVWHGPAAGSGTAGETILTPIPIAQGQP